jgi:hypothetical protein
MLEWAVYLNNWYFNNNNPLGDGGLAQAYYDGNSCAWRLVDYQGYSSETTDGLIKQTFDAYTTYYVIPNGGSVQGFRNFTDGELQNILRGTTYAANSLTAINLQLVNGAYVASGDVSDSLLSRECAYALETHINATRAGISLTAGQITRRDQLKTWALGHIDQWCVNFTAPYFRPFMGALTAKSLIDYYTYVSADATIVSKLKTMADYMWSACWKGTTGAWGAANAFLYTDRTGFDPQDGFTQPDLNMLIVPLFGWLYFKSQGGTYRTNGDLIFQGGLPVYSGGFYVSGTYLGTQSSANPAGKQYDQQLYWGPKYIAWAEAGTGTTYTSSTPGNWSTATNWTPNGVPGAGDRVIITSGAPITVDANPTTIGDSPAPGTPVVTINNGATLTINTGVSLTVRGDIQFTGNAQLINNAGSGYVFDSSFASPTSTNYGAIIGSTHNAAPVWILNGTSNSRCSVTSNTAGGNGYITDASFLQAGLVQATYTDFTNIGTTTVPFINTSPTTSSTFSLAHCTVNKCGRIDGTYNVGATATYSLNDVVFSNSIDSGGINVRVNANISKSGGTRLISNCIFDFSNHFYPARDFTITYNGFFQSFDTTNGDWTSFTGNFIRLSGTVGGPINMAGSTLNNYLYYDQTSNYNPHFIQPLSYGNDQTHDGNVFDMNCASTSPPQEGDAFTFATPSSDCTATIQYNIMLMGPNQKSVATLIDMLGNAHTSVICQHNTCFMGTQGAAVAETYAGYTGMVKFFRSNMMWNVTGGQGYKLYTVAGTTAITDIVSSANADYNGGTNYQAGTNGKGYNGFLFSSGSPGAHDVNAAPNFTDYTRNMRSWDSSKGGPGTDASAYARIKADSTQIADLISWVKGGFHPTNVAYNGTAHDGGTIGAMSYQGPTVTVHNMSLLNVGV